MKRWRTYIKFKKIYINKKEKLWKIKLYLEDNM